MFRPSGHTRRMGGEDGVASWVDAVRISRCSDGCDAWHGHPTRRRRRHVVVAIGMPGSAAAPWWLAGRASACRRRVLLAALMLAIAGSAMWTAGARASSAPIGVEAALPANAGANPQVSLDAVSCPSAGECTAVGSYTDGSYQTQGLLLSEHSGSWASGVQATPPDDASASPQVSLSAVSCASVGNCTAVGGYVKSSGYFGGLLLTESLGSWTPGEEAVPPAGASPDVSVDAVSCASAGDCTAVGTSGTQGLLLTESSGTWAPGVYANLPTKAGANPNVSFRSVSCASAGDCTAVGSYTDSLDQTHGLLLTESSGSWARGVEPALPVDSGAVGDVVIDSVSCTSAGECTAVGTYTYFGGYQGLLLRQSSGSWSTGVQAVPPPDAGPTNPRVSLPSVSCASAGNCTAVGSYEDTSYRTEGLLLTESNGTWGLGVEASPPSNSTAGADVSLPSVSCASPGNCAAVGSYSPSSTPRPLLLTESSGSWAPGVEVGLPPGAAGTPSASFVFLDSVSCAPADHCTAVGSYTTDNSNGRQGLLVTTGAANPTVSITAPPSITLGAGAVPAELSATLSSGASPVGTISFRLFGPSPSPPGSCSSGGAAIGSAVVSGNATYHPDGGFTPTSAGNYWWYATYSGDATDNPAASQCGASMPETVVASSAILSVAAPPSWRVGAAIPASSIAAALSAGPAPSGTITFKVFGPQAAPPSSCSSGGTTLGTATVDANGSYHPSTGFTPVGAGPYWWYASYGGDALDNPAASACDLSMRSTAVSAAVAGVPVLSNLRIWPPEVSLDGRKVGGRCVKPTTRNKNHTHCRRPIQLKISYTLNTRATVTITLRRQALGRQVNGRCVAPTGRNTKRKSCSYWASVAGKLTQSGTAGANSFTFNAVIGASQLGSGSYQLNATPSMNGSRGKRQTASFRIHMA